jgi:hypothetical protein
MSFHPANHLPGCMMPDGGDCCAGHAAVVDDWHRQRREIERLRHPAQAAPEPGEILQILEDEVYCDKFDGSYDYGDAVPRILALFATQPPAAPVDQERLAELQNEAGMYKSLYENAIAQRSSAGTDQEGWDLVAKSWVVLESYGFAPEACDYLPQAIDNALAAVIGARDDLLAEVTRLRAAPQAVLDRDQLAQTVCDALWGPRDISFRNDDVKEAGYRVADALTAALSRPQGNTP